VALFQEQKPPISEVMETYLQLYHRYNK